MAQTYKTRLYVLVREDLGLSVGQAVCQAAHGFEGALLEAQEFDSSALKAYDGTKVALAARNEQDLLEMQLKAREAGLHCYLVMENGYVQFNGESVATALGVGPCGRDEAKECGLHQFDLV